MFCAFALAAVMALQAMQAVDLSTKDRDGGVECPAPISTVLEEVTSVEPEGQCEGEVSEEVYENRGTRIRDRGAHKQNRGTRIQESFGKLPLYFIENQGQLDEEVAFYVKGKDKTLYFTNKGVTFSLHGEDKRWNVKMEFADANPGIKPQGQDRQEALISYFRGKKEDWKTAIPTYSKIIYENLWPGIDLVYYGAVNRLKYDFIVKPDADPDRIRFTLSGASNVVLQESGVLEIKTPLGNIEDEKPRAFQKIDGERIDVPVGYHLDRSVSGDSFFLAFQVGEFDRQKPLVIDPVVLVYCGYIGGAGWEFGGRSIAIDTQGNSYIAGTAFSTEYEGFPVLIGPDLTHNGASDIYVAKVNVTGTALVYCGYIGGYDNEYDPDIAVDKRGNAYVTGYTRTPGGSFPVVVGPDLTFNGYRDAFVAKIDSSGTSLVYCGYIGGSDHDVGHGIAVDEQENAYVVGGTFGAGLPVLVGPDLTYNGNGDVFVAKVSASGEKLLYCGYIGGSGMEDEWLGESHQITVDRQGNALVTGYTYSSEAMGFPVKVGPDLTYNGNCDAYVAKVSATGEDLLYCGYIGGTMGDVGGDIAVDGQGNAYVIGSTDSGSASFPVLVGPDLIFNGIDDAFVAKVSATGEDLLYCGYIGGTMGDYGYGIAVDGQGNAYLTGSTRSSNFPVKIGPDLTFNFGTSDAFVAKVESSGASLVYSGYIGGIDYDKGEGITVDKLGNAYVFGATESDSDSFPVLVGPDLIYNDGCDAFVAKVLTTGLFCDTCDLSASAGGTVTLNLTAGPENRLRNYFLLGSASGISPGISLPGGLTLPLNWDSFTAAVIGFANTPTFQNFKGELDISGDATATLNAPPIDPVFVGKVVHFAFVLYSPFDFVSNPVPVTIVP